MKNEIENDFFGVHFKGALTFVGHLDHPVQSVEEVCVETKNHRKIRDVKKGKKVGKIVRFENSQKKIRQPQVFSRIFFLCRILVSNFCDFYLWQIFQSFFEFT